MKTTPGGHPLLGNEIDRYSPFLPAPTGPFPTGLVWTVQSHSPSSMLLTGFYPEGLTPEQAFSWLQGSFGGRFEAWSNGRFRFIAYTD